VSDWLSLDEFAEYHSAGEKWATVDWGRWEKLRAELANYGVTKLRLDGPNILVADVGTPERFEPARGETTLDAILRFVQGEEARRKKRDR
jgi:hypothetical protein